jgi:hypothetical protein
MTHKFSLVKQDLSVFSSVFQCYPMSGTVSTKGMYVSCVRRSKYEIVLVD